MTDAERFEAPGFVVDGLLGYGATGEVWRARDVLTGEPVALKRLRLSGSLPGERSGGLSGDQEVNARLRREAVVLAEVEHRHIVRLRKALDTPSGFVLVLDLAAGGSLASLLGVRSRLPPGEVVTVAVPLAQALAHVHSLGVLHGDLTPANVLFTAQGHPLLADLGVARLVGEPVGAVDGTREFADPALLDGGPPTPASDVHGLAAVCYAALTGQAPYAAGRWPRPLGEAVPGIPPSLARAVEDALQPDPVARPPAAELACALYDACPPVPVRLAGAGLPGAAPSPFTEIGKVTHQVRPAPGFAPGLASGSASPGQSESQPAARRTPRARPWVRSGEPASKRSGRASAQRLMASPPAAGPPAEGARRSARPLARLAFLSVMPVLVAGAAIAGVLWAGATRGPGASVVPGSGSAGESSPTDPAVRATAGGTAVAGPVPEPAGDRRDWRAVLDELDKRRSDAFAAGQPGGLDAVYAPGSPAGAEDRSRMEQFLSMGARARGLRLELRKVAQMSLSESGVELQVIDVLPPYDVVDGDGNILQRVAGRAERTWVVQLVRPPDAPAEWRIASVREAWA